MADDHEASVASEASEAPLLLHSLAEFSELIFSCLEAAEARTVVEVGGEEGLFTNELLAWAEKAGGTVYCVEPAPSSRLRQLFDASSAGRLVDGHSPEALEDVDAADAYLLDGDHNYYTVRHELEVIDARGRDREVPPLVVLHDVGWPCARRDMYYAPDRLPPDAVHPYTYEHGVKLGCADTVEGGFRGEGKHAWARREGGPANGVLTAVEDFLEGREGHALVTVPGVFGLGVLYHRTAPYAAALDEVLAAYDDNPLLRRLEENRLHLYVSYLDLQDESARVIDECNLRIADLATEHRALSARVAQLEGQRDLLKSEIRLLARSRALGLAERISALYRLATGAPGLSRRRLEEVLGRVPDE